MLWIEIAGALDIGKVTAQQIRAYITYLLADYTPRRITGHNDIKLSPKTVRNTRISLNALFRWVAEKFNIPNPMKSVPISIRYIHEIRSRITFIHDGAFRVIERKQYLFVGLAAVSDG